MDISNAWCASRAVQTVLKAPLVITMLDHAWSQIAISFEPTITSQHKAVAVFVVEGREKPLLAHIRAESVGAIVAFVPESLQIMPFTINTSTTCSFALVNRQVSSMSIVLISTCVRIKCATNVT